MTRVAVNPALIRWARERAGQCAGGACSQVQETAGVGGRRDTAHPEAGGGVCPCRPCAGRLPVPHRATRGTRSDTGLPHPRRASRAATEPEPSGYDLCLPGTAELVPRLRAGRAAAGGRVRRQCNGRDAAGGRCGPDARDARLRSGRPPRVPDMGRCAPPLHPPGRRRRRARHGQRGGDEQQPPPPRPRRVSRIRSL